MLPRWPGRPFRRSLLSQDRQSLPRVFLLAGKYRIYAEADLPKIAEECRKAGYLKAEQREALHA